MTRCALLASQRSPNVTINTQAAVGSISTCSHLLQSPPTGVNGASRKHFRQIYRAVQLLNVTFCHEQVIQEVLCWSRNPMEVRRLCARKEEIYAKLIGNHKPPVVPGVPMFLETLVKHNVSLTIMPMVYVLL